MSTATATATATAAIARSAGQAFGLEPIQLDDPRPHEVLVELEAVGICHTDLSGRAGHTPFPLPGVLGHEGVGTVAAVGDAVTTTTRGERVLLSFDSCGACPACRELSPVQCVHWQALNLFGGRRLDGSPVLWDDAGRSLHGKFFGQSSFATLALASDRNVVPVPRGLPAEALAPLGCGVQTGAGAVLNVLRPEPGHTLVVFGADGVGLAAVMAARLTPATRIIAVDLHPARLELARELGATDVVDASEQDAVAAVEELTDGHGADRALEAGGVVAALRKAVTVLAVGGVLGVAGAPPRGTEVGIDVPQLLERGPRIVGINQGASVPQRFLPALVELFRGGRLPVDKLVRRYPFDEIERAAEDALAGEVVQPVLVMRG
ncbi:NAD(P)-dependent alcohol dehydrogenase [Kitasatospora sp. RB6PN24]|uniref:NAD(P)-dependent alcohol dehydrogenase n=1 Tax=Kitasatospora humi TaxID=2893891 RepID=UPI001E315DE8|nr:NAD(P)-dependent alcohol dehydrogenase [Kitasatospora humi]MCC9310420.1 NAD(P)-dependent alcohol dehydrogenase [Kitasatospora humi]